MAMIRAGLKQGVFIFAVIAVVLPLLIISGIFLSYYKQETTAEINDDNLHIAGIIRDGVSNSLKAPLRTLNVVAGLAVHPEFAPHIDDLMSQMVSNYGFFESIMVLDGNGIVRHLGTAKNIKLNRQEFLGIDLSEAEHIETARRLKKHTWSDTYISPLSGEPTLSLTVPFERGLVVGNFSLAELTTAVERHLSQTHDRIYLVNSKGRIIAHPQKTLVLQQVNVSNLPVVRAGLEGHDGIYEYDIEGVEFIGAVVTIPETNWLVIVERDKGEVFRFLRNMQWYFAITLVGALLLVAFFIGYVNTRIIKPVVEISTTTKSVANGLFSQVPHYEGRFNELDNLTRNFNRMTTALQEREQDLAGKNRDLEEEVERRILSEEEVRQSEAKLKLILENSPYAVYVLSSEGKALYINRPAGIITGYDREELLHKSFLDIVHPEDRANILKRREDRMAGKAVDSKYDFRILDKAGIVHWVENHVSMLSWEGGPATISFISDVTVRRSMEDEQSSRLQRIQQQQFALIELAKNKFVLQGNLEAAVSFVTETAAGTCNLERASIWLLNDTGTELRCAGLYERTPGTHQHGTVMMAGNYPGYFAALREGRAIDAHVARTDARTREFTDGYLVPLGITSMLDAPIRLGGGVIGVVCFEHVGEPRTWYQDEVSYAASCADQIALVMTNREKAEAQKELRDSEAFRRRVFDSSRVPIVVMDALTYQYIDCNPAAVKIYGFKSREETLGKTPLDVSAPMQYDGTPSPKKTAFYMAKAVAEGTVVFEWRHQRPNRQVWDAEVHLMSFQSDQRELLQFTLQDITERKRAEEALKMSEERLSRIARCVPDLIWTMDFAGRFTYANDAVERTHGWRVEEFLMLTFQDTVTPQQAAKHQALIEDELTKAASPLYDHNTVHFVESEQLRKDGSTFWAEVSASFLWSDDGKPIGIIGITRDITARKRAKAKLAKSEERYRQIARCTPDAIWMMDLSGRFTYGNDAIVRMYGRSPEELMTLNMRDTATPAQFAKNMALLEEERRRVTTPPVDRNRIVVFESNELRKDGSIFLAELTVAFLWSEDDKPIGVIGITRDITERKHAEVALQKSEQRYRSLYESAGDAIFLMQGEQFVDCNPRTLEIFGCSREQIIGATPTRFSPSEQSDGHASRERALEKINAALAGTPQFFEWKHIKYDGTPFDAEVGLNRIELNSAVHLQAIVRDVSERKRAEEAIKSSEAKLRIILENSPDAIYVLSFDGKAMYTNPAASHISGYNSEELMKKFFQDLVHPEDRPALLQRRANRLAGMSVASNASFRVIDRAGVVHWVENRVIVLPWEGKQAILNYLWDVTEKKKAEEEREELITNIQHALGAVSRSQKEWQDTFDSITDMISIHDKNYNVIKANKAFSDNLGLSPQEVINRKCYDLLHHGASSPVPGCPHIQTMQNKVHVSEEVFDEITNKTYYVSTYPYFSPDGEFIGSIHVSRDITEEKEREMRMIMTERLASLGQMASGIAHEINNPLESVMICAEMLLMRVAKDTYDHAQFEKYLKIIDEEVLRCRDITSNMLSFSRQTTMSKSDIDVHFLIDRACDLLGYQGRLKNVTVTKKYGEKLLVSGNEGELRQVFLVLLINALDAMENKGAITVETGTTADSAWIRISDTGPGIAPEHLQRIFNPFFSTKTEKGGTGLGLSIAHRIIANHHGSLAVVSAQDSGAAFTISLPR